MRVGSIIARIYVVAVFDKSIHIAVRSLWYNFGEAVGLVSANDLIGFENETSHVLVWIIFDLVDDGIRIVFFEGV